MTILPQGVSAGPRWKLHDFTQLVTRSDPAAGGTMRCELDQLPQDELWLVHRMVVQSDSTTPTVAKVFLNVADPAALVDGTRAGNFDVADQASPIQVPGGSVLICVWEGASAGAVGSLYVQAQILRGG